MATFNEDVITRGFAGGDMGGGLGGGVLLGLLLGRSGIFGAGAEAAGRCVTQDDLNGQTLGDIKASIPFNEAQVQLALAQSMASLTAQNTLNTQYITGNMKDSYLATNASLVNISRDIAAVDTNVDRQSTAIQQAIYADGQATRALITQNRISDLEQQLTVAQLSNAEQRSINRELVNTNTITVNMNQQQAQQQQQLQALQWQLAQLNGGVGQLARATNSSVVVGSTGVGTHQTANPTNVSA